MRKLALVIKQIQTLLKNFIVIWLMIYLLNCPHLDIYKFGKTSVRKYYQHISDLLPSRFKFSIISEELVLKLLEEMDVDKAAGIDNLSGKCLKDGAEVL